MCSELRLLEKEADTFVVRRKRVSLSHWRLVPRRGDGNLRKFDHFVYLVCFCFVAHRVRTTQQPFVEPGMERRTGQDGQRQRN